MKEWVIAIKFASTGEWLLMDHQEEGVVRSACEYLQEEPTVAEIHLLLRMDGYPSLIEQEERAKGEVAG